MRLISRAGHGLGQRESNGTLHNLILGKLVLERGQDVARG
jgi:hypothetical protein